jgi:uncharacterized protein YjbI with pentapeptide repeats
MKTNLRGVDLKGANLSRADLTGADMGAAVLLGAGIPADLEGASFSSATLTGANLEGTLGITNEQLAAQTTSLEGATMPNGQKYED